MKQSEKRDQLVVTAVAAFCLLGVFVGGVSAFAADVDLDDFDHQGRKIYTAYDATPEVYMTAESGDRNLCWLL